MPINGWICPGCRRVVGLDHFEQTGCGQVVHPDYAAAVLHSNDGRYTGSLATVTASLGCPRSRALENEMEVVVNPLAYNAILTGSAWDAVMEGGANFGCGEGDTANAFKVELAGVIAGVKVQGEIDRVRLVVGEDGTTQLTIEDHKNNNNFQAKWLKQEGVKPENVVQTSLYAELYEQTFGVRPTQGAIWHHFAGAAKAWPDSVLMPFFYPLWELDRCLGHKPYGGEYTVGELLAQAGKFEAAKQEVLANGGDEVQAAIINLAKTLPLAGKSMGFGSASFCDYCQVERACTVVATGSPF